MQRESQSPTPDVLADLGYREYLGSSILSGAVVSFYNTSDYALKTGHALGLNVSWEGNQIDYKPNWLVGRQYGYDINEATGERCKLRINGSSNWRYVVDIHESMSFVARPRSKIDHICQQSEKKRNRYLGFSVGTRLAGPGI